MQKIKTFMPLFIALLSLVGMITVAVIQSKSASKEDINVLVNQLNDKTIPYIQSRMDDIADRLARIEGKLEVRSTMAPMLMRDIPMPHKELDFKKKTSIPKLQQAE